MKHRLQRFLSGFLAAAIGLSVITTALPAPVFAAEPVTDLLEQGGWVVKKGDTVSSAKETGYTELVTQGGREMTLVTAGPNNGNGHFNPSGTPEAFYLTDSAYTNEAFSVRLVLKSERLRRACVWSTSMQMTAIGAIWPTMGQAMETGLQSTRMATHQDIPV